MIPIVKPILNEEEISAVTEVLASNQLASGKLVNSFEESFANYIGTSHAIATSSGTTALHAAILSLGLAPDTEIITTPFSFIASSNALLYCGLKPVFCDIDKDTFNISPEKIFQQIKTSKKKPRALLLVHLYGQPCNMEAILEIANEYEIDIIEDCSQAHGADWKDKKVGSFGTISTFSFYPTKNMTTGEGGIILTNQKHLAKRVRMLINHGSQEKYKHELLGYNFRMTDIEAAIGLVQLKKLERFNNKRIENALLYNKLLKNIHQINIPYKTQNVRHTYHQYTIRCQHRKELADYLFDNDIQTGIHYPLPIHKQPLYQKLGYENIHLPVSEKISKEVLSLPVHPLINKNDIMHISKKVGDFYA